VSTLTAGTDTAGTEAISPAAAELTGVIGPVRLAEQREPLVRRVALKLVRPGVDLPIAGSRSCRYRRA